MKSAEHISKRDRFLLLEFCSPHNTQNNSPHFYVCQIGNIKFCRNTNSYWMEEKNIGKVCTNWKKYFNRYPI